MADVNIETVKKSYVSGQTLAKIAEEHNCTVYRIKKILLSEKLDKTSVDKTSRDQIKREKLKDEYKHLTQAQIEEIRQTYRSGHAVRYIAKKYNLKLCVVGAIVDDLKRPKRLPKPKSN